jgi:Berberine and berberine like
LRFIKSKYDPLNLFRYPQSIAPADRLDEDMGVAGLDKPVQLTHGA